MPNLANVVLKDRAATPVDHTYAPVGLSGNVARFEEGTGSPIGNNEFTISHTSTKGGRHKVVAKLRLPIVSTEVVNGVSTPTVVRTAYADLTFSFDESSSLQERKDCVGLAASALSASNAIVDAVVTKLEYMY